VGREKTAKLEIFSSIVQKEDQYSFLISQQVGGHVKVILETPRWFSTKEEAKEAATLIVREGARLFRKEGYNVATEIYGGVNKH